MKYRYCIRLKKHDMYLKGGQLKKKYYRIKLTTEKSIIQSSDNLEAPDLKSIDLYASIRTNMSKGQMIIHYYFLQQKIVLITMQEPEY